MSLCLFKELIGAVFLEVENTGQDVILRSRLTLISRYFDPRVWVREGEKTMSARVAEGLKDFNTAGQL